jgi:hypothetical protein
MEWTMSTIRRISQTQTVDRAASPARSLAGSNVIRDPGVEVEPKFLAASPPPKRWVPHRKAEIVAAVRNGYLTLDDALERYSLTIDEYMTWRHGLDLFGLAGLRVNEIQRRRRIEMQPDHDPSETGDAPG